ncbi:MAG: glycosyltransferase [Clostridiales bacterium]|nr:glycosyltransferase [Clostridiales bacterium]
MMEVLFLEWDGFGQEYVIKELNKCGCKITTYAWNIKEENMRENEKLRCSLEDLLREKTYHFVFSLNFFPVAALACYNCGTKYVAWVYDSPFLLLYSKYLSCSTNYVFLFDYSLYKGFCEHGIKTVYYLPMAAPVEYYDNIYNGQTAQETYSSDISFVGSTYQESNQNFMKLLDGLDDYTKGYLQGIMNTQHEIQGGFILEELLDESILEKLRAICPIERGEDEWETDAWIYANYFLARHITGKERVNALKLLAEEHQVTLYTPDHTLCVRGVNNRGVVDYEKEMPLVFKNSKINLNVTLRSIHTGIPLRAMDIMGCGGFLLTNYQEDFLNFFVPGEDYVYYTDDEEMLEKAAYYLEHEEERKQIARNGYNKVKKSHTYYHRILTILAVIFNEGEAEIFDTIQQLEDVRVKNGNICWHQSLCHYMNNPEELKADTADGLFDLMGQEKELFFRLREQLTDYINRLLSKQSIEAWGELVIWYNRNFSKELRAVFWEFDYLYAFINIYIEELTDYYKSGKEPSVLQYSSIEELCRIYLETLFYLRRIEYGISPENEEEVIDYIRTKNLSEIAVSNILQRGRIYDKGKVKEGIQELWERYGNK